MGKGGCCDCQAGDALIDLVDFCVRKLRHVLVTPNSELVQQIASAKDTLDWDDVKVVDNQTADVEFQVGLDYEYYYLCLTNKR